MATIDPECEELMSTPFVVGCIDYHRGEAECPYPGWWPTRVIEWQNGWIFASRGGCDE
jgi:hypothetical protein